MFKKLNLLTIIEIVVLTMMISWSITDGFTKTLHDTLVLRKDVSNHLFGEINVQRAFISLIIITIGFIGILWWNKRKNES